MRTPSRTRARLAPALILALTLSLPAMLSAEEPAQYDYDAEIKRKQAELKRVKKQRAKTEAAIKKDRAEFEAYQARTRERQANIRKQTREIQDGIGELRKKHARLGAVIGGHRRRVKNVALMQKNFGKRLMKKCDELMALARTLPPLISKKAVAGLDYLKSELTGGSVDNVEALHRLMRMARRLDAQLMEIQVTSGSSPVPQITGTAHRLRVGGVFEAVARGDLAAVWDFDQGKWVMLDDPKKARQIIAAVEVRTGKKKPALVTIPLAGRPQASPEATPGETPGATPEAKPEATPKAKPAGEVQP